MAAQSPLQAGPGFAHSVLLPSGFDTHKSARYTQQAWMRQYLLLLGTKTSMLEHLRMPDNIKGWVPQAVGMSDILMHAD